MNEILEQGASSTSLTRRVDTYAAILQNAPQEVIDAFWMRMLWDPEPYVRLAVFEVLLQQSDFNRIAQLREREGLEAAERCQYALRLNRTQPVSEPIEPELVRIKDQFYCGLWQAEKNADSALLLSTFEKDEYPLMMDFVLDLGLSTAELPENFEDHLVFVEAPFLLPMAAAWIQHQSDAAIDWWNAERKAADLDSCEEQVDALALFSTPQSIQALERYTGLGVTCSEWAQLKLFELGVGDVRVAIRQLESPDSRRFQRQALMGLAQWLQDNTPSRKQRKSWIVLLEAIVLQESDGVVQSKAFECLQYLGAPKYVMDNLPNFTWRVQLEQLVWYWRRQGEK